MNFSINLEFFLNKIPNEVDHTLIKKHHDLLNEHIECAKKIISLKKELVKIYYDYINNNNLEANDFFESIIEYIAELDFIINNIQYDNTIQKRFFKNNIFYLSKF
jgi:hypothetical protein